MMNLNNRILLIFLFSSFNILHAQDVLKLKNEQLINAKIIEISQTEIKYKNFENQGGPTYVVDKREVLNITYQNGTKESFDADEINNSVQKQKQQEIDASIEKARRERIEKAQIDYDRSMAIYKRRMKGAKPMLISGTSVLVAGLGLTIGGGVLLDQYDPGGYSYYYNYSTYKQPTGNLGAALSCLVPGILMVYTGLGLSIAGGVKLAMAKKYKHRAEDAKAILSFEPSVEPNHLPFANGGTVSGLAMKIKF